MKIIFLDIDGVLNTIRSYYATGSQETWDAIACKYLQVLLKYNYDGSCDNYSETEGYK